MPELIVNIDHVAALRQIGRANVPDPVAAAVRIENTAVRGIAVHLWEDRRHIQDRDIRILRQVVQSEFILEMGSTAEMVGIALDLKPDRIVLVPEKHEETTTDGGLDLIVHKNAVAETIATLQNSGLPVGVFIDPDPEQISLAHQINANRVVIHSQLFCDAKTSMKREHSFARMVDAIKFAHKLKLGVTVGRGLDARTIRNFRQFYVNLLG